MSSFLLLLQITLGAVEPSRIISVQFIGGGGGGGEERVFSTSGDTMVLKFNGISENSTDALTKLTSCLIYERYFCNAVYGGKVNTCSAIGRRF